MNAKKRTRIKLGPAGILLVFGLVCGVMAVIMTLVGMTDHTDHTERAPAVVSERQVEYDDDGDDRGEVEDVTIFVDYSAEGQDFTHVRLQGMNADDFQEGQELDVAYAPGAPEHVVTPQSTEDGAYDVFLYVGIGLFVLTLVLVAVSGLIFFLRRSAVRRAGGVRGF